VAAAAAASAAATASARMSNGLARPPPPRSQRHLVAARRFRPPAAPICIIRRPTAGGQSDAAAAYRRAPFYGQRGARARKQRYQPPRLLVLSGSHLFACSPARLLACLLARSLASRQRRAAKARCQVTANPKHGRQIKCQFVVAHVVHLGQGRPAGRRGAASEGPRVDSGRRRGHQLALPAPPPGSHRPSIRLD